MEQYLLATHRLQTCTLRMEHCSYCPLEIAFRDLTVHQHNCGSRTTECVHCHARSIRSKVCEHLFEGETLVSLFCVKNVNVVACVCVCVCFVRALRCRFVDAF
jgi:hypothetical protein